MAIDLLVALVALGLLHLQPQWQPARRDTGFRLWVKKLSGGSGTGRLVLILLPPLALCALLTGLLNWLPLAGLLRFGFALVVLLFCFGPHTYEADMATILHAPQGSEPENLAQVLAQDGQHLPWHAPEQGVAIAFAALRRRFGVLLWFFLLGPPGALLYRLARSLGHETPLDLDQSTGTAARQFANILDWLPAQCLVFSLAFTGHWEAVIKAWRHWHQLACPDDWYRTGPGFLAEAARAGILADMEADTGPCAEHEAIRQETGRLHATLQRALLLWLSLVALLVITTWWR